MRWEYDLIPHDVIIEYSNKWGTDDIVTNLLLNRGFDETSSVNRFLYPSLEDFEDPFDFEKMHDIVSIILDKKEKKEKIFIYGDYDVDGITSTAFLVLALHQMGMDVDYYIPNRIDENYGLNRSTIDYIHQHHGKLIITVDTGYNTVDDIKYAKSIGIDTIITDHHKMTEEKDEDILQLNPKMSDTYRFKYLSGAGVALKLVQGICKTIGYPLEKIYKYMDIIMIGTVADVVPMIDENRLIIREGLKQLKTTRIKGLTYLMKYLKLTYKEINTTDVSYFISPLINSLGRIGVSKMGADFFLEEDDFVIYNIIEEMKKTNKTRRDLEKKIYDEAQMEIKDMGSDEIKSIFLSSEKWHPGVIGVVASRLSIKYNVPVTLVAIKNDIGKASCRSAKGINIFDILKDMSKDLIRFGGHDMASGFIVAKDKLDEIHRKFETGICDAPRSQEERVLKIDAYYPIENVGERLFEALKKISPFGSNNPHPLFLEKDISLKNIKKFGVGDRHFNGIIYKNDKAYNMVAFDLGHKICDNGPEDQRYDIVYYPEKIIFKGEDIVQIRVKDINLSRSK